MAEFEQGVLKLGRVEGIDTADELHASLREIAEGEAEIKLDGSAVISVDSTTLQMLVAFTRDHSVTWTGVSKKFKKSADMLGLSSVLGL